MQAAEHPAPEASAWQNDNTIWTYPTRFCRICREDVPPTVTMYPPGIPMQFQTPVVEYKNDDEYGRLMKPCMCRGSMRYIHEQCLLRSRTESPRSGSMWKCHECGHQFNIKRLTAQRYLSSRLSVVALTIMFMCFVVFVLGFVADPIINVYMDPYDSLTGRESIWEELEVRSVKDAPVSRWSQHFAKGFISMGLVGFLKTLFLNPFQWINVRMGGSLSSTRTTTGRDRAANLSWIAIAIGVGSAFVLFYKWVEAVIRRSLQRMGNNIVDTQLPTDDDDLKPPPGWKSHTPEKPTVNQNQPAASTKSTTEIPKSVSEENRSPDSQLSQEQVSEKECAQDRPQSPGIVHEEQKDESRRAPSSPHMSGSWVEVDNTATEDGNPLSGVHRSGWSFSNL